MQNTIIQVKPYMHCELSKIYDVSDKTFRNWLKGFKNELGEKYGRYYNTKQVEIIFRNLGVPYLIKDLEIQSSKF